MVKFTVLVLRYTDSAYIWIKLKKKSWLWIQRTHKRKKFESSVLLSLHIQQQYSLRSSICPLASSYPAGTWRLYNVESTSMQRHDVASTLIRRCLNIACPLGKRYSIFKVINMSLTLKELSKMEADSLLVIFIFIFQRKQDIEYFMWLVSLDFFSYLFC